MINTGVGWLVCAHHKLLMIAGKVVEKRVSPRVGWMFDIIKILIILLYKGAFLDV